MFTESLRTASRAELVQEAGAAVVPFPSQGAARAVTLSPSPSLVQSQRWPGFGPVSCWGGFAKAELLKGGKPGMAPGRAERRQRGHRQELPLGTERDLVGRDQDVSEKSE